jgi:hypothetical protein
MRNERGPTTLLLSLFTLLACSSDNHHVAGPGTVGGAGMLASLMASAGMPASNQVARSSAQATAGMAAQGMSSASGGRQSSDPQAGTVAGASVAAVTGPTTAGAPGAAGGGAGGAVAAGVGGAAAGSAATAQMLPPTTDYAQKGPFQTTMTPNTGPGNNYTIFRPEPLGENAFRHSPIIFGPGILTGPSLYTTLLTQLASHGFVTICVNSLTGGPSAPANLQAMQMGLEWLLKQNDQPGVFQGKLAVDRAITMGYSIGATASTQLSSHAAIVTTVSIHGHNTMGDPHGPIWLMTGTMDVIDDNRTTLATLGEAPAILTALPIGHLDVPTEISAGGRYIAPITAWLRYWVNADQGAKHFFLGEKCDVCASPWITPETNDRWRAQM